MTRSSFGDLARLNVFTLEEAVELSGGAGKRAQVIRLLRAHLESGTLGNIRKGLYYVVPPGQSHDQTIVDRYLVASKLSPDAVLAYHTALELLGGAYSTWNEAYVLISRRRWWERERFTFQGVLYRSVLPSATLGKEALTLGVVSVERSGHTLRVTGRSRALVDCLSRLRYCGGLSELFDSVLSWPSVNLDEIMAYLSRLHRPTLFASVGFLLERLKDQWSVPESFLTELERHIHRGRYVLDTRPGYGRFVARWRLTVPAELTQGREAI